MSGEWKQISRDPFARETLTRQRLDKGERQGHGCRWCGQQAKWRYRVESDGGRNSEIPGAWCSVALRGFVEGR